MYKLTPLGYRIARVYFTEYYGPAKRDIKFKYIARNMIASPKIQNELTRLLTALAQHHTKNPERLPHILLKKNAKGRDVLSKDDYLLLEKIPSDKKGRLINIICGDAAFSKEAKIYDVKRQTLILEYNQMIKCVKAFNLAVDEFNDLFYPPKN